MKVTDKIDSIYVILIASFFSIVFNSYNQKTAEKPNIVFIFIDDLGWKDLGYTGSTYYETPHIETGKRDEFLSQLLKWQEHIKAPIPTEVNPEYGLQ